MAAIALVARPRLLGAALLLGLTLLGGHEPRPHEARIEFGSWTASIEAPRAPDWRGPAVPASNDAIAPPWMADMQDYPRGMVMGRTDRTPDRMTAEVVAHWLSGLLRWLASRTV